MFPINDEDTFKNKLSQLKELHPSAGHFCYAFCLGIDQEFYRYSDDGEPSGTAGKPIYGQLLSKEITNVGAVVLRYYGGTKLGVSGLINAYRTAAADAISNAQITEKELQTQFHIRYKYDDTAQIERILKDTNAEIIEQNFTDICQANVFVPLSQRDNFTNLTEGFDTKEIE